ncbi:MAG: hypothetical protein O3A63_13375 [Proteobacteria bacterium]|nr:hypothetical protein [Pseudomonadota bacterium]
MKPMIYLVLAIGLAGCATQQPAATHHWVSADQVTSPEYQVDNNYCSRVSTGSSGQSVFETNSEAYGAYVACMNERGYQLTASNTERPY